MNDLGDPWEWDVDKVVKFFCGSEKILKSRPHAKLPDPGRFEQTLRDNHVDGATLLVDVDKATLRNELGIKSLGEVSALIHVINDLRGSSRQYQRHGSGASNPEFKHEQDIKAEFRLPPATPVQADLAKTRARPNEHIVEDASGQKKRRLNLVNQSPSPAARPVSATNGSPLVATTKLRTDLTGFSLTHGHAVYQCLGHDKALADEIFYGRTRPGEELNVDMDPHTLSSDDDSDQFELMLINAQRPMGRQTYVNRLMQHFLRNTEPQWMQYGPRRMQALFPYRVGLSSDKNPRSFTTIDSSDGTVKLVKHHDYDNEVAILPQAEQGDWDFLNHWQTQESQKVLPAYGESDWDGVIDQSWGDEISESGDDGEGGNQPSSKHLDNDRVRAVVDQAIEGFVIKWQTKKLPLRKTSAWSIWRKGNSPSARRTLAKNVEREIAALNRRMELTRVEIEKHSWTNEADLQRQCVSLEETVIQREELQFKVNTWLEPRQPERHAAVLKKRKKKPTRILEGDEVGFELSSESEIETDDLGNFVEAELDDTPSKPSIPRHSGPVGRDLAEELIAADDEVMVGIASPPEDVDEVILDAENPPEDVDEVILDAASPLKDVDDVVSDAVSPSKDVDEVMEDIASPLNGFDDVSKATQPPPSKNPTPAYDVIILSSDSEDAPPNKFQQKLGQSTRFPTEADTLNWTWKDLEGNLDRRLLILKILRGLDSIAYEDLRKYSQEGVLTIEKSIFQGLKAFINDAAHKKLAGYTVSDSNTALRYTRLWICWVFCAQKFFLGTIIPPAKAKEALQHRDGDGDLNLSVLIAYIKDLCSPTKRHASVPSSQGNNASPITSTLSFPHSSPHKKRKKEVDESQDAILMRARRKQHQQAREERVQLRRGPSFSAHESIAINPGRAEGEDAICINPQIAARIQKHQVEGVQFLWGEIVAATRDESAQGCLLSHTMGLGKTMQAITLLVTIAEASNSSNPAIRSQVPESLRRSQTLLLVPSSVVLNWMEELAKWMPQDAEEVVGHVFNFDEHVNERLLTLEQWYENGGVLVISYDLFSRYIHNSNTKTALDPATHAIVKTRLLDGPNLIIADEAHKMKNAASNIAKATAQFVSKSRVALTGSPLSNNLMEYYEMIDWVAPGYLGGRVEFKANFEEPIKEGSFIDSTAYERQKARHKLKVLEQELDPKVQRRDVTVLQGTLKTKTEFVITTPLTDVQHEMYLKYLALIQDNDGQSSAVKLFDYLNVLTLLCTHPTPFMQAIVARYKEKTTEKKPKDKTKPRQVRDDTAADAISSTCASNVDNESDQAVQASKAILADQSLEALTQQLREHTKILGKLTEPHHAKQSYRTKMVMRILRHAEAEGDGVLVFSQHIATLDYLEGRFVNTGRKYVRLDGTTSMTKRKELVADFNRGTYNVFLISTRAGGLGINIPGANRVVIWDYSFNPQWEEQAIGRAYRIGQQKPVFVYRFVAGGTIEEKLFNMTVFKRQLAFKVVEKANVKSLAARKLEYLSPGRNKLAKKTWKSIMARTQSSTKSSKTLTTARKPASSARL